MLDLPFSALGQLCDYYFHNAHDTILPKNFIKKFQPPLFVKCEGDNFIQDRTHQTGKVTSKCSMKNMLDRESL